MRTASRILIGVATIACVLAACGDDDSDETANLEKTIRGVAAAEVAGDPEAAAVLMTDNGIAAFYDGVSRADLLAGKFENFGVDKPSIEKVTASQVDGDAGSVTIDLTIGDGYVLYSIQVPMVKQDGKWLVDNLVFGGGKPIEGRSLASVNAVEYAYTVKGDLSSGNASIEFTNDGKEPHEMLLLKIPDGIAVDEARDAILASDPENPDEGYEQIAFLGFAPPGDPTQVVNFAKTLPNGDYAFVCFVPVGGGDEGPPHLSEGMISAFTVG